ncbi:MAG: macro domain-containing protein [Clostridia bacterium]
MITYIEGNIFHSPAQVIVNTVNTVGVMGKGLALSFKKKYPIMFEEYSRACEKHQLSIGKLMFYYAPDHWILLFPTKENWRNPSKMEYIEKGLRKFANTYADQGITSIAFPRLGCGNGALNWEEVRPLMEKYLKPLPIKVYIYLGMEEAQAPEHQGELEMLSWLHQNAKDMSFCGLCDDIVHGQSIAPYQVTCNGADYLVKWKQGLQCTHTDGSTLQISEDQLFEMWDTLRTHGALAVAQEDIQRLLFFELLKRLGYLTPVRIYDGQEKTMEKGYQVNEGYDRAYALRGDENDVC